MSWTPETIREQTDHLFETAREMRIKGEKIVPIIFLFIPAFRSEPNMVMLLSDQNSKSKDEHKRFISEAAMKFGAQFVARVDEAWMVGAQPDSDENAVEKASEWVREGRTLEHYDGRLEVIHLVVDGPGMSMMYWCEIKANGNLGPTNVVLTSSRTMTGRFTDLSGRLGDS